MQTNLIVSRISLSVNRWNNLITKQTLKASKIAQWETVLATKCDGLSSGSLWRKEPNSQPQGKSGTSGQHKGKSSLSEVWTLSETVTSFVWQTLLEKESVWPFS